MLDVANNQLLDKFSNFSELTSDPVFIISLILVGLIVGIAIGLSGLGGAPLLLPSLIIIGIPPQLVIGVDLAFIFGTKIFAGILHGKERNINWNALFFLLVPVVPVMIFASWVWLNIKNNYGSEILDTVILVLLGVMLLGLSLYMIKDNFSKKDHTLNTKSHNVFSSSEKSTFLGAGAIIGFITQITATGAGAMTLPVLVKKCNCPPKHVAGTSVVFGIAISAVGTLLHFTLGNVSIYLVLFLLVGSIPGVFLGVRLTSKISPKKLLGFFGIIILVASIFLINRGFGLI